MDEQPINPMNAPGMEQHHQKNGSNDQFLLLSRQVSDLLSRLRLLEERYANLRREHQITSQNMIENHQGLSKQQRKLSENIIDVKRTIHELNEQLTTMRGELTDSARSYELKTLERYVSYWDPMQFITRTEATKLIEEALQRPKLYKSAPSINHNGEPTYSASENDASARNE